MDLSKIPTGANPPYDLNAIIEIPQGGEPVKYEIDKESGALMVDRFLHTAMFYPANYGFIPHTLADDGDMIRPEHLSARIHAGAEAADVPRTLNDAIEDLKRRMLEDALRESGSKTRAAERLGLSRQSFQQMLRRRQG